MLNCCCSSCPSSNCFCKTAWTTSMHFHPFPLAVLLQARQLLGHLLLRDQEAPDSFFCRAGFVSAVTDQLLHGLHLPPLLIDPSQKLLQLQLLSAALTLCCSGGRRCRRRLRSAAAAVWRIARACQPRLLVTVMPFCNAPDCGRGWVPPLVSSSSALPVPSPIFAVCIPPSCVRGIPPWLPGTWP